MAFSRDEMEGHAFQRRNHRGSVPLTGRPVTWCLVLARLVTAALDHVVHGGSTRLLHFFKVTIFPLVINKYLLGRHFNTM